jgi:dienelactone hydrolase
MTSSAIDQFQTHKHCYLGTERLVYAAGSGALVVLLHEIPNATPETFDLGLKLVKEGFRVHIPILFGTPNAPFSMRSAIKEMGLGCIKREFAVFASDRSSPVVEWLRALCIDLLRERGQDRIGMIGMCFTGNFALGLIAEDWMKAPILSQPSLPYAIGRSYNAGLHVSPETIKKAKERDDLNILGLRFTYDWLCPKSRFQRLDEEFGEAFQGIEIDSSPFNSHQIPVTAHSVLTLDLVDKEGHPTHDAWLAVLDFLSQKLLL